MTRPRHDAERLRLVGRMEQAARVVERNHVVPAAMDDEQRHVDLTDAIDGAVLVDHDVLQRKERPHQTAYVHDRGEGRFKDEGLGLALQTKPRGNSRAE